MASRDEILAFAAEYLELDAYPDYGPMGLQVLGAEDVTKIACGVSASRDLFVGAGEAGAQLVLVHHGLFWDKESRIVDRVLRGRLKAPSTSTSRSRAITSRSTRTRRSGTTRSWPPSSASRPSAGSLPGATAESLPRPCP